MTGFSNQPKALGICDRCGFETYLNEMVNQIIDQKRSGIMVCRRCNDIDQEQLQLGKVKVDDPKPLKNPRPDIDPGREPLDPLDFPFLNSP